MSWTFSVVDYDLLPCCVCFEKSRQNRVVIDYFENGSYTRPYKLERALARPAPVHVSLLFVSVPAGLLPPEVM